VSSKLHGYNAVHGFEFIHNVDGLKIIEAFSKYKGRPYERSGMEFLRAKLRGNKHANMSSVFCSELVATVLQDVGVLPLKPYANNYSPDDIGKLPVLKRVF
jgi:hypothetical protein